MTKAVVFFGTRLEANRWAMKHNRDQKLVFLGTQCEQLQGLNHIPDVVVDEKWDPTEMEKARALLSLDVIEILKVMYSEPAPRKRKHRRVDA